MTMPPRLRKFALTAHITLSVGWIGAVAAYIALDVAAATSQDAQTLRAGLLLAAVLSTDLVRVILFNPAPNVAAVTVVAALVHPAGRGFFRSFSVSRINWLLLGLVGVAAVPLVVFASINVGLQGTVPDDHAGMGHYGFMAAFGFTVIGVGLLASLRPDGWRLGAWVAALLPALLGVASVLFPGRRLGSRPGLGARGHRVGRDVRRGGRSRQGRGGPDAARFTGRVTAIGTGVRTPSSQGAGDLDARSTA